MCMGVRSCIACQDSVQAALPHYGTISPIPCSSVPPSTTDCPCFLNMLLHVFRNDFKTNARSQGGLCVCQQKQSAPSQQLAFLPVDSSTDAHAAEACDLCNSNGGANTLMPQQRRCQMRAVGANSSGSSGPDPGIAGALLEHQCDRLNSANQRYQLVLRPDGMLLLWDVTPGLGLPPIELCGTNTQTLASSSSSGSMLWLDSTSGAWAVLESDTHQQLYSSTQCGFVQPSNSGGSSSSSPSAGAFRMQVQDWGEVVVLGASSGTVVWSSQGARLFSTYNPLKPMHCALI